MGMILTFVLIMVIFKGFLSPSGRVAVVGEFLIYFQLSLAFLIPVAGTLIRGDYIILDRAGKRILAVLISAFALAFCFSVYKMGGACLDLVTGPISEVGRLRIEQKGTNGEDPSTTLNLVIENKLYSFPLSSEDLLRLQEEADRLMDERVRVDFYPHTQILDRFPRAI